MSDQGEPGNPRTSAPSLDTQTPPVAGPATPTPLSSPTTTPTTPEEQEAEASNSLKPLSPASFVALAQLAIGSHASVQLAARTQQPSARVGLGSKKPNCDHQRGTWCTCVKFDGRKES